jgi:hypothetical protein
MINKELKARLPALLADWVNIAENNLGVNDKRMWQVRSGVLKKEQTQQVRTKYRRRPTIRREYWHDHREFGYLLRTPKHSTFKPRSGDQIWRLKSPEVIIKQTPRQASRRYSTASFRPVRRHYSNLPISRCCIVWYNEKSSTKPQINYTKLQAITLNCSLEFYNVSLNCWSELRLQRQ